MSKTLVPTPNRRAIRDFKLGYYDVRANTILTMNLYWIFRDPRVWNDPTHFNPDANFPLDGSKRNAAVEHLLPFGIGKRVCLGETLARQEIFLFFVGLLYAFRVEADPNLSIQPKDIGTSGITPIRIIILNKIFKIFLNFLKIFFNFSIN